MPQVIGDWPDQQPEKKGNPPAPQIHLLRAEGAGQGRAESRRQNRGHALAGKLPAGEEAPPLRVLLREKSGCDAELSAGGEALNEPGCNDQRRR